MTRRSGGDDFDRAIAQQVLAALGLDAPPPALVAEVLAASRKAKEALTDAPEVELTVGTHRQRLARADLEEWIRPFIQKTGAVCRRALKDAGVAASELDGVILVGGATRVPAVRRFVTELFGREPLSDIDPDQVVALGAAVQADLLTNADRGRTRCCCWTSSPCRSAWRRWGAWWRSSSRATPPSPPPRPRSSPPSRTAQTGLDVHVLQGERELVEDCRSLARFTLGGIPPLPAGMARVEVRFQVNADGILAVTAREQSTGTTQSITVKPSHGLSDEEIEQMLLDSIDHAEDDVQVRQVREQRVEAERVLTEAERQLGENGALLAEGERPPIDAAMARVRELARGNDSQALKDAIHALDEVCKPFVERIMNQALTKVVAGHSVEEF